MAAAKQTAIADIRTYIEQRGGAYREWYVGIATDPRARLFRDHGVGENGDFWIYRECESSLVAREVKEFFVRILGADGGVGGGYASTQSVYAYLKTPRTYQ